MEKIDVRIHVNPSGINPMILEDFNPARDGKIRSDEDKINVNKSATGYSVVYESDVFNSLDKARFLAKLVSIFNQNLPGYVIDLGICYNFETDESYDFDYNVFQNVMSLDLLCNDVVETNRVQNFIYTRTDSIEDAITYYEDNYNNPDVSSEEYYDQDGYDEDEYVDGNDPYGIMAALSGFEDSGKKKKKHKNSKEYYGRSRVWKNAKNPKKSVKRHGVIVADDKDDIKKDEKIIKEFLKDFLPGSSSWQKDFRSDVLKRFINMYTVSKKNLKRLENNTGRIDVRNTIAISILIRH